jgi:predicted aconitase with swiveling domain
VLAVTSPPNTGRRYVYVMRNTTGSARTQYVLVGVGRDSVGTAANPAALVVQRARNISPNSATESAEEKACGRAPLVDTQQRSFSKISLDKREKASYIVNVMMQTQKGFVRVPKEAQSFRVCSSPTLPHGRGGHSSPHHSSLCNLQVDQGSVAPAAEPTPLKATGWRDTTQHPPSMQKRNPTTASPAIFAKQADNVARPPAASPSPGSPTSPSIVSRGAILPTRSETTRGPTLRPPLGGASQF